MSQIYEKWRDLTVNFDEIKFKNISLKKIISYPPAGNDVVEAEIIYDNKKVNSFTTIFIGGNKTYIKDNKIITKLY